MAELKKQLEFDFMTTEAQKILESWELERRAFIQNGIYRQQLRELEENYR